jgi:hypothetical protein
VSASSLRNHHALAHDALTRSVRGLMSPHRDAARASSSPTASALASAQGLAPGFAGATLRCSFGRRSGSTEETAWMSAALAEAWPYISVALVRAIRDVLEPAIRARMPVFIPSIVFTSLDMGTASPRVTSVAVRQAGDSAGNAHRRRRRRLQHKLLRETHMEKHKRNMLNPIDGMSTVEASVASFSATTDEFEPGLYQSEGIGNDLDDSGESSADDLSEPFADIGSVRGDAIMIELGVVYDGNPLIHMALNGASTTATTFGVDSAHVAGRVELIIAPLIPRIPICGAVQASFINPPDIDFSVTGLAAGADVGQLSGFFRSSVNEAMSSLAVLPNRLVLKLDPSVDFLQMALASHPIGVVRIAVISGQGFPLTDTSPFKQSLGQSAEPDVYVLLHIGASSHRTSRVDDNTNPVFDDRSVFDFIMASDSPSQTMRIEAWDYDLGSGDDMLGWSSPRVIDLVETPDTVVRLGHSPMGATPRVRLAAQLLRLSKALPDVQEAIMAQRTDLSRPSTCSTLMLSIAIDRAWALPSGSDTRPLVRVNVNGKRVMQTLPAYNAEGVSSTEAPPWEYSRHVLLEDAVCGTTAISFEVRDEKGAGFSKSMGTAFVLLSDLLRYPGCANTYTFAIIGADNANARMRLRIGIQAVMNADDGLPFWQTCTRRRLQEKKY